MFKDILSSPISFTLSKDIETYFPPNNGKIILFISDERKCIQKNKRQNPNKDTYVSLVYMFSIIDTLDLSVTVVPLAKSHLYMKRQDSFCCQTLN